MGGVFWVCRIPSVKCISSGTSISIILFLYVFLHILQDKYINFYPQRKKIGSKVSLERNKVYRLFAISYNNTINAAFYVSENKNKYVFIFQRSIYNNFRTITFLLKDANYSNLPIGEGELVIWQK